jgi:hypothetical protein
VITQHAIAITNFFNQVIGRPVLNGLSPLVSSYTKRKDLTRKEDSRTAHKGARCRVPQLHFFEAIERLRGLTDPTTTLTWKESFP